MKLTQVLFSAVAATLIVATPLSSQTTNTGNSSDVTTLPSSPPIISPIPNPGGGSHNPDNTQIGIARQAITKAGGTFTVPAGLPFLKVWVHNQASSTLTVQVKKIGSNTNYILYQVPAGKALVIPNQAKGTGVGDHAIYFSGADGTVSGEFTVVMASTVRESQ
ncbi:hypothetical protein [Paenibacillus sp. WLX2291]|uniref:hypothetical protein n=1 Tax=Paenibacillus sp. WLX2291 TaxID=3296934 RepID=UPI003983E14B